MTGTVADTYLAALQHGHHEPRDDERLVGVVRRPMYGFADAVDENRPALGPPDALLDDAKAAEERLAAEGASDAAANRRAWEAVDFAERYRDYLSSSEDARRALTDLVGVLRDGTDVALVCYENTDEKRCHRTIVRAALEERLDG
jgi:uncharacterized protein YeaO (DUF488 family)